MQNNMQFMPGYRLNEYQLILSPHEDLRNRIIDLRKGFNETYQPLVAVGGRPQLTLVRFVTWNMLEEKIMQRLKQTAMGFTPFKVELKDFGSYPSHSIFINITTKLPVQQLAKEIKGAQKLMKAHPDYDPHFIQDPNILIGRKLAPWQYEKGWLEYSNRHFTGKFIADGMLLLKRPLGGKAYEVVQRMDFMNLPVATRQGELFA